MDDEGVLVPVVVRNDPYSLESHLTVKGLCSMIAPPYLCPYLFEMASAYRLLKEFFPDALSPVARMNSDGNNMSFLRKDYITPDLAFLSVSDQIDINEEGFRIKMVEVDEGGPIVWRLGKRQLLDLKNAIQIG